MATEITNAALITEANKLVAYIGYSKIPYVPGGMSLEGMDCQGLMEYLYIQCGIPKSVCNLAGSNAHYRAAYWAGTPERLCEICGVKEVPEGINVGINSNDGGEPAKYKSDGMGNTSHMGVYIGDGKVLHASESVGCVTISTKFNGKKSVPNGGWNCVWLDRYINYGFSDAQMEAIKNDGNFVAENYSAVDASASAESSVTDVTGFYTIKRGCKGGAVERLQSWLVALGYMLTVDHDFGPTTEATVKVFQRDHGLEIDGVVGAKTWTALAEAKYAAEQKAQG